MNRSITRLATLSASALAALAGLAVLSSPMPGSAATTDPYADLPATISLNGVCRDFRWANETHGHPDFEYVPTQGYAHYVGEVQDQVDSDGKPVFSSTGHKVTTEARDAQGRNRMPVNKSYIASRPGDTSGVVATTAGGSLHTAAAFAQWFRDTPGVNLSRTIPITLVRQPNTNLYSFNDQTDPVYHNLGGFFPINNDLFGNSPGQSKNFGFTFELNTRFVYKRGTGQVFTFTGDDDVFVFVDGKLVVDIGGVHSAVSQTIDIDRLNWLEDGHTYTFQLFFAERHTTQSNVRIDTTLTLLPADLPTTTALFD